MILQTPEAHCESSLEEGAVIPSSSNLTSATTADLWFDTLEEVVAEVKFDEEGITAPIL